MMSLLFQVRIPRESPRGGDIEQRPGCSEKASHGVIRASVPGRRNRKCKRPRRKAPCHIQEMVRPVFLKLGEKGGKQKKMNMEK